MSDSFHTEWRFYKGVAIPFLQYIPWSSRVSKHFFYRPNMKFSDLPPMEQIQELDPSFMIKFQTKLIIPDNAWHTNPCFIWTGDTSGPKGSPYGRVNMPYHRD